MTGSEERTTWPLGSVTGALGGKVRDGHTHTKQLWLTDAEQGLAQVSGELAGSTEVENGPEEGDRAQAGQPAPEGAARLAPPLLSCRTLDLIVLTTGNHF